MKVTGESLSPFLRNGDFVLVLKAGWWLQRWRAGDVVVFRNPAYGRMIKRVQSVSPDGFELFVVGDDPDSIDSRQFGAIACSAVIGKVILMFRQSPLR